MFYVICLITSLFFCLSNASEKEKGSLPSAHSKKKLVTEILTAKALVRHLDRRLTHPITNRIAATLGSGRIFIDIATLWNRYLKQEKIELPLPISHFSATGIATVEANEGYQGYIGIETRFIDQQKLQRKSFACDVINGHGCVVVNGPGQADIPAHFSDADRQLLFNGVAKPIAGKALQVSGQQIIVSPLDYEQNKGTRQFIVTKPNAAEKHIFDSDPVRFAPFDIPFKSCTISGYVNMDQTS